MRCGTVAIVGRTNVGKSTFLNACLGEKIAIVSPLPQTTRDELLGVVHRPTYEIAFLDTPGFHRPKSELGRRMNQTALESVRSHDAVVFITDVTKLGSLGKKWRPDSDPIHADDRRLLTLLPPHVPAVLVLNKVDLLRDKGRLLPLITAFNEAHQFKATIPASVLRDDGVEAILNEVSALLPEGEPKYSQDDMTDRPATFFVREFVREQVMLTTQREVPHAVAVTVERYEEGKVDKIQATIHVEKAGQRIILVGRGGEGVKAIGMAAREQLEKLLGKQIHLELFIRVTERWKDMPRQLSELGYTEGGGGRALTSLLPTPEAGRSRPKPSASKASAAKSAGKGAPARTFKGRGSAAKGGIRGNLPGVVGGRANKDFADTKANVDEKPRNRAAGRAQGRSDSQGLGAKASSAQGGSFKNAGTDAKGGSFKKAGADAKGGSFKKAGADAKGGFKGGSSKTNGRAMTSGAAKGARPSKAAAGSKASGGKSSTRQTQGRTQKHGERK